MSKICPRCSADTEPVEEETSSELCIHEKIAIAVVAGMAVIGGMLGLGLV